MFLAWSVGLRLALATFSPGTEQADAWRGRLGSSFCYHLTALFMQASSLSSVSSRPPASEVFKEKYVCVSSAYWWKETSWWRTMSPSGAVYIAYSSGLWNQRNPASQWTTSLSFTTNGFKLLFFCKVQCKPLSSRTLYPKAVAQPVEEGLMVYCIKRGQQVEHQRDQNKYC